MGILSKLKIDKQPVITNIDWQKSKAHLLLLSKFIRGQKVNDFLKWGNYWENVLNESLQIEILRFIDEGMLIYADLTTLVSKQYRATELKDFLRQRGIDISGTKDKLVQRLIQADKEGITKLVAGTEILTCTQAGREIAERYITSEKEKRIKVEQQVKEYLADHNFKEASLTVSRYEAEQVFSRGTGIDWKHHGPNLDILMLNNIFNKKPPKIIERLSNDKLEVVKIATAMMELWGDNKAKKWLPDNFETGLPFDGDAIVRMIEFQAVHKSTLERYRNEGIKRVEIYPSGDSCEACKLLAGKRYKIKDALELPYEHCTHKMGCRCGYLPVV
jgi:hypothetical protein